MSHAKILWSVSSSEYRKHWTGKLDTRLQVMSLVLGRMPDLFQKRLFLRLIASCSFAGKHTYHFSPSPGLLLQPFGVTHPQEPLHAATAVFPGS